MINKIFIGKNLLRLMIPLGIVAWLMYHFITISFSPLPWFDEVFFADLSASVHSTGKLYLEMSIRPEYQLTEVLYYGPVYFYVQAALINIFGLNLYTIRLLNLLSGMALIMLFLYAIYKMRVEKTMGLTLLILLLTDTIFQSNMHSGRMDLFCMFLFFSAFFILILNKNLIFSLLAGVLFACAYLTTPRCGFYLLSLFLVFVFQIVKKDEPITHIILRYLILSISFSLPVLGWILFKFGSIEGYISYMISDPVIQSHLGIKIFPNKHQIPAIISAFSLFLISLKYTKAPDLCFVFILLIIIHLFFIKEVGPYSAMIMPVIYSSIILSVSKLKNTTPIHKLLGTVVLLILIVINISLFSFKAAVLFAGKDNRDMKEVTKELTRITFKDKIVLADYKYYYIVNSLGGRFRSYDYNKTALNEENMNNVDLILLSDINFNELVAKFPDISYDPIHIGNKKPFSKVYKLINHFGFLIETDFSGFLLEVNNF